MHERTEAKQYGTPWLLGVTAVHYRMS